MKTLIFLGAARVNGHTRKMAELLARNLPGEIEWIDAYRTEVASCRDCRYCWKKPGCCIQDKMQEIYQKINEADAVVFASPVYFHSVTGELKKMIDRMQIYWASHVRGDRDAIRRKKGAILLVGGAPSFPQQFDGAKLVLNGVLGDLNAEVVGAICLPNSDRDSLETRPDVAEQVVQLARKLQEKGAEQA